MNKAVLLVLLNKIWENPINNKMYHINSVSSDNSYLVTWNKNIKLFTCNCNNIRNTDCYHIKGTKLYLEKLKWLNLK